MRTREGSVFDLLPQERAPRRQEEVLLDQDEMASRLPYLMVPQCKPSPCHTMLATPQTRPVQSDIPVS